jgi:large subunit ribosomal protein L23
MSKDENQKMNILGDKIAYKVLIEPWVTESTTLIMELNKYVFKVSPRANKQEIKKSIEEVYGVTVEKVNTINVPRKLRVQGRTKGWKSGFKKAIVSLKEGDKIDFYEK